MNKILKRDDIVLFLDYAKHSYEGCSKSKVPYFLSFFLATLKKTTKRRMFRRFVRPHCKNLKTLCMFLIILQSSKSGVASNWCCQIWDVFTCWRSASYWNSIELVTENSKLDSSLPFEYELDWTAFLASGTPQKWISRGKRLKNDLQVHQTGHWKFKMGFPSPSSVNWAELHF